MATYWTLKVGGVERSFAYLDIELNDCVMTRRNGAADVFTFTTPADFDSTPIISYEQEVVIQRDRIGAESGTSFTGGTVFFVGYGTPPKRNASGDSESISYELRNWWWKAERCIYKQLWHQLNKTTHVWSDIAFCNIFLGINLAGTRLTNGQQIADALTWLAGGTSGRGVNIQQGTISPSVNIFTSEARAASVAEVIRQMMAHSPDALIITDYTTTSGGSPKPTVHVKFASGLSASTMTVGTDDLTAIGLTPRYDIQCPVVVIYFKRIDEVNGKPYIIWGKQVYPTNPGGWSDQDWEGQIGAQNHTVELQGSSTSTIRGTFSCKTCTPSSAAWWKTVEPKLASIFIDPASLTVTSVSAKDASGADVSLSTYPCVVTNGQVASWMGYDAVPNVTIKATVSYSLYSKDASGGTPADAFLIQKNASKEVYVKVTLTDAPQDDYDLTTTASYTAGEDEPTGLAQSYYGSMSTLYYEGEIADINNELPAGNPMNNKLTLAGSSLSVTNQLIQSVTENIGMGTRSISIGMPEVLDLSALMELHRASRTRRVWNNPLIKTTGEAGASGGDIGLGKHIPKENTTGGLGEQERQGASATVPSSTDKTLIHSNAVGTSGGEWVMQRVTSAGAVVPEKGVVEIKQAEIQALFSDMAEGTRIPATGFTAADCAKIKLREVQVCLADGTQAYAIALIGAPYTKST